MTIIYCLNTSNTIRKDLKKKEYSITLNIF